MAGILDCVANYGVLFSDEVLPDQRPWRDWVAERDQADALVREVEAYLRRV
jgi:hypothetical protein